MKTLDQMTGMPQMGAAFSNWTTKITLKRIAQKIIDGLVSEETENITFQGVVQPLSAKQLALKPEGDRAFQWLQIHCLTTTQDLVTNDRIEYAGQKYKIMNVWNWQLNNFIEYHAVEDFQK